MQNKNNLVGEKTAYLTPFRTNKEFENKGYFSKLYKFTLCPSLLGVKNYSQNKPYRNQYQKYCYKHYLN